MYCTNKKKLKNLLFIRRRIRSKISKIKIRQYSQQSQNLAAVRVSESGVWRAWQIFWVTFSIKFGVILLLYSISRIHFRWNWIILYYIVGLVFLTFKRSLIKNFLDYFNLCTIDFSRSQLSGFSVCHLFCNLICETLISFEVDLRLWVLPTLILSPKSTE
jgi:hypothetical protein